MRFRSISVREGVYEVLARLAEERGVSISDVIAGLINCCLNKAVEMGKVEELLRQCLERFGKQSTMLSWQQINVHETTNKPGEITETPLAFEDNPWVHIIRAKMSGGEKP